MTEFEVTAELQVTIDEWNFLTPLYLENLAQPIGQHIPYVLDMLDGVDPKHVLDIGCGNGDLSNAIKVKFPNASVRGVDICEAMIDYAVKHKATPDMEFIQAPFPQIPESMKAAQYDVIVCSFTLMYMPDHEQRVREMRDLLAPGGRLVVSCWGSAHANPWMALSQAILSYQREQKEAPADAKLLLDNVEEKTGSFCLQSTDKMKNLIVGAGLKREGNVTREVAIDMKFTNFPLAVDQVLAFFHFMSPEYKAVLRTICTVEGYGLESQTFPAAFVVAVGVKE